MNLPDTSDENRTACFKDEVVRRYSRICTDWAAKQETIQRHQAAILECQALQEQLGAQGADCEAAARMLGAPPRHRDGPSFRSGAEPSPGSAEHSATSSSSAPDPHTRRPQGADH